MPDDIAYSAWIDELDPAATLDGTEGIVVVQDGVPVLATAAEVAAYGSFDGLWPAGSYLQPDGSTTAVALIADRAYYTPLWVPEARTCTQIMLDMTVSGAANSVTRVAFYSPDANGRPGALLVDGGTIDTTVAAAVVTKAVSQALPRGLVWVLTSGQGSPATQPTMRFLATTSRFVNLTTTATSTSRAGYIEVGVSGAPPATATPLLTNSSAVPWVSLKS